MFVHRPFYLSTAEALRYRSARRYCRPSLQRSKRTARHAARREYHPVKKTSKTNASPKDAPGTRRIIKTARTEDEINEAARHGLRPLVQPVKPGTDIHACVAVFQNPETGEIQTTGDGRWPPKGNRVMDFTSYYPYHFPNPFAAYLLPKDLAVGEEVWLEDLIEDVVAAWGNQGYNPRLPAAAAVWNGTKFDILFDPERDAARWIG